MSTWSTLSEPRRITLPFGVWLAWAGLVLLDATNIWGALAALCWVLVAIFGSERRRR